MLAKTCDMTLSLNLAISKDVRGPQVKIISFQLKKLKGYHRESEKQSPSENTDLVEGIS